MNENRQFKLAYPFRLSLYVRLPVDVASQMCTYFLCIQTQIELCAVVDPHLVPHSICKRGRSASTSPRRQYLTAEWIKTYFFK